MDYKISLLGYSERPQTLAVAGALSCFEEECSAEIFKELSGLPPDELAKKERAVLKNSFGRGHGSVGDQTYFTFSLENVPRVVTLHLCLPEYAQHLQQSLRRANPSRGFHLPEIIKKSPLAKGVNEVLAKSFELYDEMRNGGIPAEDARFLLPLYTKTNIQTTINVRELCHLWLMSQDAGVPSIVKAVVEDMLSMAKERAPYLLEDFGSNYELLSFYPSAQFFYAQRNSWMDFYMGNWSRKRQNTSNETIMVGKLLPPFSLGDTLEKAVRDRNEGQLANLKHVHFEFCAPMSIACLHQAIRQRTWNHSVETVYEALPHVLDYLDFENYESVNFAFRIAVPPSIKKSQFDGKYRRQHQEMLALSWFLWREGIPRMEAVGVIPHSLKVHTLIHINGWNAIHSIGKRTCTTAQWEIREIAQKMAGKIKEAEPAFNNWAEPQCVAYGKCPEAKECGYYKTRKEVN